MNTPAASAQAGATTEDLLGGIVHTGITDDDGAHPDVRAQLGYGPATANPQYEGSWTWRSASYMVQDNAFDVYAASVTAPAAGSYRFAYRFSLDEGVSWTYCDANEGDYGAGSFPGFTFEFADLPVLEVTE